MSTLHVVFGDSAAGTLKMALRPRRSGDSVVSLADDLSWGPISGGLDRRIAYFDLECPIPDGWQWLREAHAEFSAAVSEWTGDVLIWLGSSSACEHAGYLAYLHQFHDRPADVVRPDEFLEPHAVYGPAGSIGVLNPEQMTDVLENAPRKPVANDFELSGRWRELEAEDSVLRIVADGRLVSAPVDHFDGFIIDAVGSEWKPATRVVGDALGGTFDARLWVPTDFLFSRVANLVKSGALEAQGDVLGWTDEPRRASALVRRPAI